MYIDLFKYSELIKKLLVLADYAGVNFRNFIVALFENPGKLGPLGLIEREVVVTAAGDRIIVFKFGEAAYKLEAALRTIKAEI